MNPPTRFEKLPLWVAAVFAVPLAVNALDSVWWPIGFDQGAFAWVGDVILQGGMPYHDAWEVKSPLTHYAFATAQWIFGRHTWGIRLLDLGILAGGAFALWRLLASHGSTARALAMVAFVSAHFQLGFWDSAQPDPWSGVAILFALLCVAGQARPSRGLDLAAGVLVGAAGLFKLPYLALGGAVAAAQLARSDRTTGENVTALAISGLGAVGTLALCLGWFALNGAASDLIEQQLLFNAVVHQSVQDRTLLAHARAIGDFLRQPAIAVQLPLALLGGVAGRREGRPLVLACGVWLLLGFSLVIVQNKYYAYHWAVLEAPLAILTALGVAAFGAGLLRRLGPQRRMPAIAQALAVATVGLLMLPPLGVRGLETFVLGRLTPEEYYRAYAPEIPFSPVRDLELAGYVRGATEPEDRVFVWGLAPGIHYLSGRRPPTRFGFNYPLVVGAGSEFRSRYRKELMGDLRETPPALFVIATRDKNNLFSGTSFEKFQEFGALQRFVRDRYVADRWSGHYQIWKLRPAPDGSE